MDRTSSPTTYSRSESNSVPGPRTMLRCWPSSWRSWASFSGRCRRLRNGGSTRTDHGTVQAGLPPGQSQRPQRAHRHPARRAVAAALRHAAWW